MPTRAELAENTAVHLLPRPDYPVIAAAGRSGSGGRSTWPAASR